MTGTDAIVEMTDIDCRFEPYNWPYEREAAAEIDAHWTARRREAPALFDGRVLLMRGLAVTSNRLHCTCFEASFRGFLAWRERGFPGHDVVNCFGMSALQARDGSFLLGEMSKGTASEGRLYFPAGTPEPSDVRSDGSVDFEANVLRELREETGLIATDVSVRPGWDVVFAGPLVACMKRIQSSESSRALQARLEAFNASQQGPELVRLVPVSGRADLDERRMPRFMLNYLDWALGSAAQAR